MLLLLFIQCNISLFNGRILTLVLAGQFDGEIVLLHNSSSLLSMSTPCPAHDGHVTKLVGSSDILNLSSDISLKSALASYGKSDDKINVWGIVINEEHNTFSLQLLLSIKMASKPQHMSLMGTRVCVSLDDDHIVMLITPSDRRTSVRPHGYTDVVSVRALLKHQPEDEHSNKITSLTACSFLNIFVSCSNDGVVKAWNSENQLIAEMEFGTALSSVGFANSRGDLLVGLQQHISIIRTDDYLPDNYLKSCPYWDLREKPMIFDPDLEFWLVLNPLQQQACRLSI